MRILIKRIFPGMYKRWAAHRNRKADLGAYKRWLKHHPGCTFKDFYVETIQGLSSANKDPTQRLDLSPFGKTRETRFFTDSSAWDFDPATLWWTTAVARCEKEST